MREFYSSGYPGMRSLDENVAACRGAGYTVLGTHTLPDEAWVEGYYELLGPRALALAEHPDAAVREFAAETLREIEAFERSEGSHGCVFYLLQRA